MIASQHSPESARSESAASLSPAPAPVPAPSSAQVPQQLDLRPNEWEARLHALACHVQQQELAHHALTERVEKQEAYIRTSLKERDWRLTKTMNDILAVKAELAKIQREQRKSSIWHRLFRLD